MSGIAKKKVNKRPNFNGIRGSYSNPFHDSPPNNSRHKTYREALEGNVLDISSTTAYPPLSHKGCLSAQDALGVRRRLRISGAADISLNQTKTTRDIEHYRSLLMYDIENFIYDSYNRFGHLTILDSGCGDAVVASELLEKPGLSKMIKFVHGISMDLFAGALRLAKEKPDRFQFHHDCAEDALAHLPSKVNVIFDIWGPVSYSLVKMDLIRAYYEALETNGTAFIYLGACFTHSGDYTPMPSITFVNSDGSESTGSLLEALSTRYPRHFSVHQKENRSFRITKSTPEFPVPGRSHHKCHALLGFSFEAGKLSRREMLNGNAAMPSHVQIRQVISSDSSESTSAPGEPKIKFKV